jgi:hypothetical protein
VLCAQIAHFMNIDKQTTVLYYFCNNYRSSTTNNLVVILRSFCGQLLRANSELAPYIYEEYVGNGSTPSVQNLQEILPKILSGFKSIRMIVDGLDEWDQSLISKMLKALMRFTSHDGLGKSHKLLFSSRDVPQIGRVLSKKSVLCLSDERRAIDAAIAIFVHDNI